MGSSGLHHSLIAPSQLAASILSFLTYFTEYVGHLSTPKIMPGIGCRRLNQDAAGYETSDRIITKGKRETDFCFRDISFIPFYIFYQVVI